MPLRNLPFDRFLALFCSRGSEPMEDYTIYRGGTACLVEPHEFAALLPEGSAEVEAWGDGFRQVYRNDRLRAIITLCEGDVDVTIHPTAGSYQRKLDSAAAFYAAHS